MQIPDLVGERLDDIPHIIENQYPLLKYEIIYYCSPKSGRENNTPFVIGRVVRQKRIDDKKLELIVSFFKAEPEII